MTDLQLKIIYRAVKIRYDRGEDIDEAVAYYTKLTESEAANIKNAVLSDAGDRGLSGE